LSPNQSCFSDGFEDDSSFKGEFDMMVLKILESGKVAASHIHRNQSLQEPKYSRVSVPKASDEDLEEQDDSDRPTHEDGCSYEIAQYQRLPRMADVSLSMPIIWAVSPHRKSALVLAKYTHSAFKEVCNDKSKDHCH
jgi:hypothetical protein